MQAPLVWVLLHERRVGGSNLVANAKLLKLQRKQLSEMSDISTMTKFRAEDRGREFNCVALV
jgi:hypothetical protein